MCSMTSQGSAHTRFRRAVESRNALVATATAHELPHISLADALALTLLLRDVDAPRYPRAALRWHRRLADEAADLTLEEATLALTALLALPGRRPEPAARCLLELLELHGLDRPADELERWLEARA